MIFMIKTYSDFLTSLATLKSTDLSPGTISSEMKASEFNNLMNNIESALNTLYVKLRTLNDIHDYIKKYIQTEINDKRKEIQENLKIIEDLSDSYTNFDYVTELVPFLINQNEIIDNIVKIRADIDQRTALELNPMINNELIDEIIKRTKEENELILLESDQQQFNNEENKQNKEEEDVDG